MSALVGIALKFIKTPLGMAIVAIVVLLLLMGVQTLRLHGAQADLRQSLKDNGVLTQQLADSDEAYKAASDANIIETANVASLAGRLREITAARASEAAQRAVEIAARDAALVTARRDADRLRRQLNADWSSTSGCQSLSALHVNAACPAVAQRVHDRTAGQGGHQDSHPGSPG